MHPVPPDLIAALARERYNTFLREAEQQRLGREVRRAQIRPDAPGWVARVRRTLAFRRRPVHGQVVDCLIGLAATEFVEHQPERAVPIIAAAGAYAQQEGTVNVYSEENPGRETR